MRVRARFFASLAERLGTADETIEVPEGTSPAALWERLSEDREALHGALRPAFARNGRWSDPSEPLADGDEVAFLPPVSGG